MVLHSKLCYIMHILIYMYMYACTLYNYLAIIHYTMYMYITYSLHA